MRSLLRALAALVPARFKAGPSMPEVYRFDALDAEHLPYHERLSAFTAIGNWVVTLGKATLLPKVRYNYRLRFAAEPEQHYTLMTVDTDAFSLQDEATSYGKQFVTFTGVVGERNVFYGQNTGRDSFHLIVGTPKESKWRSKTQKCVLIAFQGHRDRGCPPILVCIPPDISYSGVIERASGAYTLMVRLPESEPDVVEWRVVETNTPDEATDWDRVSRLKSVTPHVLMHETR